MLLFGSGRAGAQKRFLVQEGAGSNHRCWKLAQSVSVLDPMGTEEKPGSMASWLARRDSGYNPEEEARR